MARACGFTVLALMFGGLIAVHVAKFGWMGVVAIGGSLLLTAVVVWTLGLIAYGRWVTWRDIL
jgi:hypothetical protein